MPRRVKAMLFVAVTLMLPHGAQAQLCDGDLIATGTPAGRQQIERLFGEPKPEWTQLAAFAAAVVPEQQDYAYELAKQRLLNAGSIHDDELGMFQVIFVDMKQANSAAAAYAAILGGTVGGVLGLLTGDVEKGVAGAAGGGGAATAVLAFPVKLAIDRGVDDAVQLVLDKLIREPCFMSAGDALAQLEAQ